ncbi:hypothetical protein QJS04_geneDACA009482 [Acorus gramineus]|uniref:Mitochondrial ribosomal protein L18 n=1 Tax=Acorus gramineus TaxID=55184 RepID=A0AAV9AFN1_ACOGR|nr:hypothetical protein QJS04_geneDACA009482 [Acorus gramineus]
MSCLRRCITSMYSVNAPLLLRTCNLYSKAFIELDKENVEPRSSPLSEKSSCIHSGRTRFPQLLPSGRDCLEGLDIEVVDTDIWRISTGLDPERTTNMLYSTEELIDRTDSLTVDDHPDLDEIEDLRLCGNLTYKLDRWSREAEEYNVRLGRKNSSNKNNKKQANDEKGRQSAKMEFISAEKMDEELPKFKKVRTPTYNQLTDPYHLPFCLDIHVTKGSVRACVIHRVTSNVVVVAHSISKDMKRELTSTRDAKACVAVGEVLARRAIADDIHNVVYTPRKGEKLEGKLWIVLQSIIDNGIDVKVKIKQSPTAKVSKGRPLLDNMDS